MKRFRSIIVISSVLVTLFAVGANAQNRSGKQPLSGRALEQKIYIELLRLPNYGVFDFINFQVNGSTVVLDGKVNSLGTRKQAARVVRSIPGVTNVINNIDNLPPSGFDNRIRQAALREFARGGLYQYLSENRPDVRIIVENGRITLEGYVANSGDYDRFNILANGIPGVFKVTNHLIVGRDSYRS